MRRGRPTWMVPAAVLLAGVVLTLARLGEPATLVFDEVYYVNDARAMLAQGVEDGFAVHPPLGKWLLAAGIAVAGDHPLAWRLPGALAGAFTAMLVVLIVRCLTGREAMAGLAGLLVLLDGAFVVQARTAMLDIHLALFVVLGVWLLLVDRDRHRRPPDRDAATAGRRWWLIGAGAAFGAALAVKWSAALALAGAVALLLAWETGRQRAAGRPSAQAVTAAAGQAALTLLVVPLMVYAATWTPWLVNFERTFTATTAAAADDPPAADGAVPMRGLVDHHRDVLRFHLELQADHPYRAPATTWPVQSRPVVFHYEACGADGLDGDGEPCLGPAGRTSEIVALGNLALWWGGLALLPVLVAAGVRRDRRAGLALAMLGAQYLPWLMVARPVFSFYAVPMVPFLAVGVAVACDHLDRPARRIGLVAGTLAGAGLAAVTAVVTVSLTAAGAAPTRTAVAAVAGGLLGAAAGTWADLRAESRGAGPSHDGRRLGTGALAVLGIAAAALAVYFAPVWYGIPLPDDAIRDRWWFDGWV